MKVSSLRLLLCRAGDVRLALDAVRVRAVLPYDPSQGPYPWVDELVPGLRHPETAALPFLVAFGPNARVPGVVIPTLEDMTTVAFREVRPLPPLVARFAGGYGLWGIVLIEGVPRLLFDPEGITTPAARGGSDEGGPEESDLTPEARRAFQ